uniref:Uncharacterized protein n=1 Tax=Hucho hucho TaxID=62062 RepID=A0A4W5K718_9TELE
MGSCRAATITGTLSRISLNDEEDEKGPEGLNYSTLPGNIISKVMIQQPGMHMGPMGEMGEGCLGDSVTDMRRTVYLCTDDALRQSDQDMGRHGHGGMGSGHDMGDMGSMGGMGGMGGHSPQGQMMETDYIVMPRASAAAAGSGNCNTLPTLLKDDSSTKMNMGMGMGDTLPHDRMMQHYKMAPDFNMSPTGIGGIGVMEHMNMGVNMDQNLQQQYGSGGGQEHMQQNLPFEPRTAVKNFLAEMEETGGLSRSETGSTISMSSLERRKSRYQDMDFEKVMHTRKRHMELFQELNQKFQTLDRFQDIPNMGSMDKAMANKNPWESYNPACEYQNYASMNALDPDPKDSLEMTAAEWEKCVNLPLDVQEGDFQTEV